MADEARTEDSLSDGNSAEFEALEKRIERLKDLFEKAFDELHAIVFEKTSNPYHYFSNHHDYPRCSTTESGFPFFNETGFYEKNARKNYVGSVRPGGILGMLTIPSNWEAAPKLTELVDFLDSDEIGEHFRQNDTSKWEVEKLIQQAVESYFQKFGLGPLDPIKRRKILAPIINSAFAGSVELRIVVPIALTHFERDRLRLSRTAYITRIPGGIQLSRARMDLRGSGAGKQVVGAATHAFVSTGWSVEFNTNVEARRSMNNPSKNVLDEVELFLRRSELQPGLELATPRF